MERRLDLDVALIQNVISANLAHPDLRIRQVTARLASMLPEEAWTARWAPLRDPNPTARLTLIMAALWKAPSATVNQFAASATLEVLRAVQAPDLQLEALRLLQVALGDFRIQDSPLELFAAYDVSATLDGAGPLVADILKGARPLIMSPDELVSTEAVRLVAMLRDTSNDTPGQILSRITPTSRPARDLHNLIALSRTRPLAVTNEAEAVTGALLGLDRKQTAFRGEQDNWHRRWNELASSLLTRDPSLGEAWLRHAEFPRSAHLRLVPMLQPERRAVAAQYFRRRVETDPKFPWTPDLVAVLSLLPRTNAAPLFRQHWDEPAVRDDIILYLAADPQLGDRERFVWGLTSRRPEVVRSSMNALTKQPPLSSALVPAIQLLDRLLSDPEQHVMRAQALALVNHTASFSLRVQ